jgi:hypothetical protein
MLHDVTICVFPVGGGMVRHVVTVDATSGDDAASQGAVRAALLANGAAFHIVGVAPTTDAPAELAPDAGVEGADDPLVPDELEPPRRGPGRPRKVADPA